MRYRWLARTALFWAACAIFFTPAAPSAVRAQDASGEAPGAAPAETIASWIALSAGAFFPTGVDGAGAIGFAVLDEPVGPQLWSTFARLGGVEQLGQPLSRPFALPDGRTYQVFERAMLRWRAGGDVAEVADTLDLMWAAGREGWLVDQGVPPIRETHADALTRIGWLTDDPIRDTYFATQYPGASDGVPAALARYGMPASEPVERDGVLLQRFDKALLARDVATGEVSTPLVGTLLIESGLLPPGVLAPDRVVGGQLVARGPRGVVNWPNARGWGVAEPVPVPAPVSTPVPTPVPTVQSTPGPSVTPTGVAVQPGAVLFIKAVVNQGRAEHVVIANEGTAAQDLTGWSIRSGTGGQQIAFPVGFTLQPGATVRVHSGTGASALHRPPTDLFGTGTNIWNNAGDQANLTDPSGRIVNQLSYAG